MEIILAQPASEVKRSPGGSPTNGGLAGEEAIRFNIFVD